MASIDNNNNQNTLLFRISESGISNFSSSEEPVPVENPIYIRTRFSEIGNSASREPIRLPTDVCVPISGNPSDISIRSSEERYRESELRTFPKAGIATVNNNPIGRAIREPLIPTAENPRRVFKAQYLSHVSPLKKKETIYGAFACILCFLLFLLLWIFIPRDPLPKLSSQEMTLDYNSKILMLKQTYTIYNNNLYTLQIMNWNMNMTIMMLNADQINGNTIVFQTNNNYISIPARTSLESINIIYDNYTSAEPNFDLYAKSCNSSLFQSIYYTISLQFKEELHPSYQYSESGSTSSASFATPFSCTYY